ncbi:autotransporter assembly complex protein TamA [Desulfovibrio sp. OttesenSCG-928-A18]|nr:autotransporter assembly complex protein TamA [Desulfovibrio sp. OttesenSCG-928-A18]
MRAQYFLFMLIPLVLLNACAGGQKPFLGKKDGDEYRRSAVRLTDPEGPIPAPTLPQELAALGRQLPGAAAGAQGSISYSVVCEVRPGRSGSSGSSSGARSDEEAAVANTLTAQFARISQLHRLADNPPPTVMGLEQRLAVALEQGRELLHSQGFFSGRAFGKVEAAQGEDKDRVKAVVRVVLLTGPRYSMGKTRVLAPLPDNAPAPEKVNEAQEAGLPKEERERRERRRLRSSLPASLADVGLAEGAPAVATDVLDAVDRAVERFQNNGYPYATLSATRYVVDHASRTLEAELAIYTGEFVRMGDIEREGAPGVRQSYIDNQRNWRPGSPWSQARLDGYRDSLRQSGLFQRVDVNPGSLDEEGNRSVHTTLESAPERTVGGSLKYHSDFGAGAQVYWEHRNLSGHGDRLRLESSLWGDMQEATLSYRMPHAFRRDMDFIANAGFLHQDTDAYNMTSAAAAAGLERRFSRNWSGNAKLSAEGGNIKEPKKTKLDYFMFGVPLGLIYNDTDKLLDASRGGRLFLSATPYTGEYDGNFTVLRGRAEARAFFPLDAEAKKVLALRGVVGVLAGEDADKVPPSARFYSGGGGSVRGYQYQSLGPRNSDKDPLGGGSLAEVSAEARWRITPEWGMVAFVDGGMVYEEYFKGVDGSFRWGAGLGLRYFTVIGPVRFDVATPLNPRGDDDPVQFYISIGQSF